jgi:hypothetical protein
LLEKENAMNRFAIALIFATVSCVNAGSGGGDDDDDDGIDAAAAGQPDARIPPPGADAPTPGPCTPDVIDPPTTAECSAETDSCLEDCDDEACDDACLAADPNPDDCADCVEDAYDACANAAGCQAAWDAYVCCTDGCADPDSDECETVTCAAETAAYDDCADAVTSCDEADLVCFP